MIFRKQLKAKASYPNAELGPMYATDRQTSDVRRASSLNAPYHRGESIIMESRTSKCG